ncbi:hypothetical protein PF011_g14146 [Phytophthora fragariae]|uniref:DUF6818 domain-containing protein n=1 Tax=Phytophthora fragariae TaxID=53985 RepID=A0A6A3K701_9STRA|nr:hypothetical protein PF011_g14146 [Phytophthora fragariae]
MQRLLTTPLTQLSQGTDTDQSQQRAQLQASLTDEHQQLPRQQTPQRQQRARGAGFSDAETAGLLDLLEAHLPLSRDEWDYVASLHNAAYVGEDRTTDSLKRKFAKLHRKRIPTGDPNIPTNVLKAKRVRGEMTRRADLGDGEDAASESALDFVASTPPPAQSEFATPTAPEIFTPPPTRTSDETTPLPVSPIVHRRSHYARNDKELKISNNVGDRNGKKNVLGSKRKGHVAKKIEKQSADSVLRSEKKIDVATKN